MHLSLDAINMVDDSCPSPGNFHEMVKGAVVSVGTHVHSIDVILGFTKDPVPLLNPGVNAVPPEVTVESPGDAGKQDHIMHAYGTVSPRDKSELPAFHGQFLMGVTGHILWTTVNLLYNQQFGSQAENSYDSFIGWTIFSILSIPLVSMVRSNNSSLTWVQTLRLKQTI